MNIYQKLLDVRKVVGYLQKENQGHQYKYVSSSQVLAAVRSKMDEAGLMLIPRIDRTEIHLEKNAKQQTEILTELWMTFTWVNADKPDEKIECPWYAQGMDTAGEKGVGKALTYAEKYFLLKEFNIATDKDDPDAFQGKHDDKQDPKPAVKPKGQQSAADPEIKALFEQIKQQKQILINDHGYTEDELKGIVAGITKNTPAEKWSKEIAEQVQNDLYQLIAKKQG